MRTPEVISNDKGTFQALATKLDQLKKVNSLAVMLEKIPALLEELTNLTQGARQHYPEVLLAEHISKTILRDGLKADSDLIGNFIECLNVVCIKSGFTKLSKQEVTIIAIRSNLRKAKSCLENIWQLEGIFYAMGIELVQLEMCKLYNILRRLPCELVLNSDQRLVYEESVRLMCSMNNGFSENREADTECFIKLHYQNLLQVINEVLNSIKYA